MSFFRNIYKVATSVCRKDKSLNQKRANPYADSSQSNNEGENLTLMSPKPKMKLKEDFEVLDDNRIEEETNELNQKPIDNQQEKIQNEDSAKNDKNVLPKASSEEQIDNGDMETNSSSEGSEQDSPDEQGPYKKRKMDIFVCSHEEEKITRTWKTDLKSIQKSIGRMNRLFEIYEGYKKKRDPLTISPEKMQEEHALVEQTQECEEVIEDFQKENVPNANIINQISESFESFDKQFKNCAEFYQPSPQKQRIEQPRRLSCSQDLLANLPTLPDPAGVGI